MNRNIRNKAQNKPGPQKKIEKNDNFSQKYYCYKIISIYNSLKRELTLMNNFSLFKKWLKIYHYYPETLRAPKPVADLRIIDINLVIYLCQDSND